MTPHVSQLALTVPRPHTEFMSVAKKALNEGATLIITGGTVDHVLSPEVDSPDNPTESLLPRYLREVKMTVPVDFVTVCMKDSRSINEDDRRAMVDAIARSPHRRVVITHGTFTMAESARFVARNADLAGRVVVFTGAMTPLDESVFSDAGFNLGFAFAQSMFLPDGVYLCMNGAVFEPDRVAKIEAEGRFGVIGP